MTDASSVVGSYLTASGNNTTLLALDGSTVVISVLQSTSTLIGVTCRGARVKLSSSSLQSTGIDLGAYDGCFVDANTLTFTTSSPAVNTVGNDNSLIKKH